MYRKARKKASKNEAKNEQEGYDKQETQSLDRLVEIEAQELAGDNDVLDYTIDQFRVAGIRRVISEMKREDQIIIRKIEEGYNLVEIAEILGVSPAAVNQKLNTIRKKIKNNLENLNF